MDRTILRGDCQLLGHTSFLRPGINLAQLSTDLPPIIVENRAAAAIGGRSTPSSSRPTPTPASAPVPRRGPAGRPGICACAGFRSSRGRSSSASRPIARVHTQAPGAVASFGTLPRPDKPRGSASRAGRLAALQQRASIFLLEHSTIPCCVAAVEEERNLS